MADQIPKVAIDVSNEVFFRDANRRLAGLIAEQKSLAHYTSVDVAFKLLTVKKFWLRNASDMNDYGEMRWGLEYLDEVFEKEEGKSFWRAIEQVSKEAAESARKHFDRILKHAWTIKTYISCLCEHDDFDNRFGKLSMWRAYGNVAIVFKRDLLSQPGRLSNVHVSPVAYFDKANDDLERSFLTMANDVDKNAEILQKLGPDQLSRTILEMLRFAMISLKHPAFKEEAEWRVIFSHYNDIPGAHIKREMEQLPGKPQFVCKIPMEGKDGDLEEYKITDLIEKIILGPMDDRRFVVQEAFVHLMRECGYPDAHERVIFSEIPLRR